MKKKYCECGQPATEHFAFAMNGTERAFSLCSECSKKDPDRFQRAVAEVFNEATKRQEVKIEVIE